MEEMYEPLRIPGGVSSTASSILGKSDPCIFELGGPILFTAPHGISVLRGGHGGEPMEPHLREKCTTVIALKLAKHASVTFGTPASFMIWDENRARSLDPANLDPNHLTESQFPFSPWHRALEAFKSYGDNMKVPLLHIDIHGKQDRPQNLDLDIGLGAMKFHWKDSTLVSSMESIMEEGFLSVFKPMGIIRNDLPFSVEMDPEMCGLWSDTNIFTQSTQSALLGIPSVQLEIPRTMRQWLVDDNDFLCKFGDCLMQVYKRGICNGNLKSQAWYLKQCASQVSDIDFLIQDTEKHEIS